MRQQQSGDTWFATTRWTVVLQAGDADPAAAAEALRQLCETYWYPLYGYVRHRGHSPEDAEDLTQGFFERLLTKQVLPGSADRQKGRFRAFLLASLKHYMANEWDRARAAKRGGGRASLPLDGLEAESRYALEPTDLETPERLYERRWAMTLLESVLARLQAEYEQAGKGALFVRLRGALTADSDLPPYAEAGAELGLSAGAVKVAVHRMRQRYRALLREEVGATVADPAEIDAELRALLDALRRP